MITGKKTNKGLGKEKAIIEIILRIEVVLTFKTKT